MAVTSRISSLLGIIWVASYVSAASAQSGLYTPNPGVPERVALMDAMRAAQGSQAQFMVKYLKVFKGVGKQVCNPWLKLEPNMATECKYLLLIPPPPEAAGFVPAGMLPAYHKPLSRHIHHLMVYPGWRNARQRCRTADGAVRRLAPIPLELPRPGGLPHLRRGESEALPPGGGR